MRSKKKTPLFGQHIPQDCAYCYHNSGPSGHPICTLHLPEPEGKCRSYLYDPLMREPRPAPALKSDFDPEDFKL